MWSKAPTLDRIKQFGVEQVKKMIDFETDTVELVVDFITSNNVPCDFRRCGSVSLTSRDEEALEMKHTLQLLKQLPGFKDLPVEYLDAEQIQRFTHGSTAYKGGILSKNAGQLWPAKLIFFVVQKAIDLGLHLWTQTTVTQVRKEKNSYIVSATRDGKKVQFRAKSVVYATNGYSDGRSMTRVQVQLLTPLTGLLPQLKDIIVPVRGQAIVTSPIKPIIPHNLSMNDGYEYMIHRGMKFIYEIDEINLFA
ncbi:FAD-binding oxidoreductase [Brasilonema sp. CT11]|nr:FAD-binding oxidoreductase [Brasilonema sp. CT11]